MADRVRNESDKPNTDSTFILSDAMRKRLELAEFVKVAPAETGIDAREFAGYMRLGVSTLWKFVADGKIRKPTKYGSKVSVWPVGYVRELAQTGFGGEE